MIGKAVEAFDGDVVSAFSGSSKLQRVIEDILMRRDNGAGKIVFCHFRAEIDVLARILREQNMHVKVCDGRTTATVKKKVHEKADVLILQIQSGSEGLNLQENFSEVYFTQPHWNPCTEDQAVGRCYRMGQEKDVKVYKYAMENIAPNIRSIDEHIQRVQDRKKAIIADIIGTV